MPAFKDALLRGKPNPRPIVNALGASVIQCSKNFTTCLQPLIVDGELVYAISRYGKDELLLVHDDDDLPLLDFSDDPWNEFYGIKDPLPPGLSKAAALETKLHLETAGLLRIAPDYVDKDYYAELPVVLHDRSRIKTKYPQTRFGRFLRICHLSIHKFTHSALRPFLEKASDLFSNILSQFLWPIYFFLRLIHSSLRFIYKSVTGIRKIEMLENPEEVSPETTTGSPDAQPYEKGYFICPICGKKELTYDSKSFTKYTDMRSEDFTIQQMQYINDDNRYGVYLCRHCHDRMLRRANWFLRFALLSGIVFLFTIPALVILVALSVLLFKLFAMKLDFTFEHAWECGAVRRVDGSCSEG